MPSITITQFCTKISMSTILFFGIGQHLFGCSPSPAQLKAWSEVEQVAIIQQGLTDRAALKRPDQQEAGEDGKITILPAPEQLPTITTTTVGDDQAITETKIDTTALAVQQLGKVALALAGRTEGEVVPQIKSEHDPIRITYQRHPMPQSNAPEIIKNLGTAINASGIVSGFLGWMAADTIQEVSKVPSHRGDYIRTDQSFNPTSTTTNLPEEE